MSSYCGCFGAEAFCADGSRRLATFATLDDRGRRCQREGAAVHPEIASPRRSGAVCADLGRDIPRSPGDGAVLQAAPAALALVSTRLACAVDLRARRSETEAKPARRSTSRRVGRR